MFVEQLQRAVEASPRVELARVAQLLWKAYAAGQVTETEASELSEAIELKRAIPPAGKPVQRRFGSRPRSPASMGSRHRAGEIARLAARTGNMVRLHRSGRSWLTCHVAA